MHGLHEMAHCNASIHSEKAFLEEGYSGYLDCPWAGPHQSCSLCLGHFQIEVMRMVHRPSAVRMQTLHPDE